MKETRGEDGQQGLLREQALFSGALRPGSVLSLTLDRTVS